MRDLLKRLRLAPSSWLIATTLAVVIAFAGATVYAAHVSARIDRMADEIANNADPSIRDLATARTELRAIGDTLTLSIAGGSSPSDLEGELTRHEERLQRATDAYVALPFFATERDRWNAADVLLRETETKAEAVIARVEAGDRKGAMALQIDGATALQRADAALERLIAFDADQGSRLGEEIGAARRDAEHAAYVLDGLACALALAMVLLGARATREHVLALERARDAEGATTRRLRGVASSAMSILERLSGKDPIRNVLQATADAARRIADADFAALGIGSDPKASFDPCVSVGVDAALVQWLCAPQPKGVFGAVTEEGRSVRVDDVTTDARFVRPPSASPPVGALLGVALRHDQDLVGELYLARKPGRAPFTEQDARAIELLAAFAASAAQNAKLHAALRAEVTAREDLLSMVSHDLRNPLSALTLAARMLGGSIPAEGGARNRLDIVTRNAARMERMISELLTAAKLREGRLSIEAQAQDIRPLVADAMEMFAVAASERGISLSAAVGDDVPPVFCDGERIVEVLCNLVGNALKFTPRGGSIAVSVRRAPGAEREVCISVRDTGVGIAEDALAHVFDRYWQKKEHASRGTGLGLFIAKGIVESHHGRIWVTSRPGEGSDFQFTLPAAEWLPSERPSPPPPSASRPGEGLAAM